MNDNTYGINKRINFIAEVISELKPSSVLGVGCGTGSNLTKPLAELFSDINFVGIDDDSRSIDCGVKNNKNNNLTFGRIKHLKNTEKFDLIIASEVIEHVENPHNFLLALKKN
jgi:2-polyprenyl-3-methyl-5-hydroxy-6-metoxy-1,4-benzoquinol methylase